jgi:hypothetical protein
VSASAFETSVQLYTSKQMGDACEMLVVNASAERRHDASKYPCGVR